jgi:hypothetical protein
MRASGLRGYWQWEQLLVAAYDRGLGEVGVSISRLASSAAIYEQPLMATAP